MGTFVAFLLERHDIQEVSNLFPREAMNDIFRRQIAEVQPLVIDAELKSDLERLGQMDFVGYVDRSLRRGGFADPELDELVTDMIVKLLIAPGGLVSKWKRDAPLSFRLTRAVKNAVATVVTRTARRRRRFTVLPDDQVAEEHPRDEEDLISDFRKFLEERYGASTVEVFNARLEGLDIKALIGRPDIPTSYALKGIVQRIKAGVVIWAGTDPAFQEKIRRLMEAERTTLDRRFGRVGVGAT